MTYPMMPSRYEGLVRAMAGYSETGIPCLGYHQNAFGHPHFGDDEGIFCAIPKLAHSLHLDIGQAMHIFFVSLILLSLISGLVGFFLLLKTRFGRAVAAAGLCLVSAAAYHLGDVYVMSSSLVAGIIPLFLFLMDRRKDFFLGMFLFFSGLAIGAGHFVRAHSGTGVLMFLFLYAAFSKAQLRRKVSLALPVAAGILIPVVGFTLLLNERDAFLTKLRPGEETAVRRHVFWHSAYIGLGFLQNSHGIRYQDEVAIEKVRNISPDAGYLSAQYEDVLRREVLNILRKDPVFILETVLAKAGILLLYFLIAANIGLIAAVANRKDLQLGMAFWPTLVFSSLPGLIVMPYPNYLLGFIALSVLYGIIHMDICVHANRWNSVKQALRDLAARMELWSSGMSKE